MSPLLLNETRILQPSLFEPDVDMRPCREQGGTEDKNEKDLSG